MKALNVVYKAMALLNLIPLLVFYFIDNQTIKELAGFGFFYMVIWILTPAILLSVSLYIYNGKNLIFEKFEMKNHLKIVLVSIFSFLIVIINGVIRTNII